MASRYLIVGFVIGTIVLATIATVVWGLAAGQMVGLGAMGLIVLAFFLMNTRTPSDPATHEETKAALLEAVRGAKKKPRE